MRNIVFIIIVVFSFQAQSQLYKAKKGWRTYLVEINNDSAHFEIYDYSPPDFFTKSFGFAIPIDDKHFNIPNKLRIGRENFRIRFRRNTNDGFKKLHLEILESNIKTYYANRAYSCKNQIEMSRLQDSLSGPDSFIRLDVFNSYRRLNYELSENEFAKLVDGITDSLTEQIEQLKNPNIDLIYQKSDSINTLDSIEIFNLLSDSNYKFNYSKYILQKIAKERPEVLIAYIDNEPENEKTVLKSIRNHNKFKEITQNIEKSSLSTEGKKKIVKQKSKRIISDIAIGTVVITATLAYFAGLIALGIWIF